MRGIHLEVDPTEAPLLHSEVRRDLQEARGVRLLLDSGALIPPLIRPCVAPPPAGRRTLLIHNLTFNDSIWRVTAHTINRIEP